MPNRFKVVDTRMAELVMVPIDTLVDKVDTTITMDPNKEEDKDHLQLFHRFLFPSISLLYGYTFFTVWLPSSMTFYF